MTNETRLELVLSAIRWANNMLAEVQMNHAAATGNDEASNHLRTAIRKLNEADLLFRQKERKKSR